MKTQDTWVEFVNPIPVAYMDLLPNGCITSHKLISLANQLSKMERWYRQHRVNDVPCLRLVQGSRDGRITALVQVGSITLKLQMKGDDWIVLGDALKVSD